MDFVSLMNLMMDFQAQTDARFYVEDGRICAQIPTSYDNVRLFEMGQKLFFE